MIPYRKENDLLLSTQISMKNGARIPLSQKKVNPVLDSKPGQGGKDARCVKVSNTKKEKKM